VSSTSVTDASTLNEARNVVELAYDKSQADIEIGNGRFGKTSRGYRRARLADAAGASFRITAGLLKAPMVRTAAAAADG
jgi:hypothetical protein